MEAAAALLWQRAAASSLGGKRVMTTTPGYICTHTQRHRSTTRQTDGRPTNERTTQRASFTVASRTFTAANAAITNPVRPHDGIILVQRDSTDAQLNRIIYTTRERRVQAYYICKPFDNFPIIFNL